MTPLTNSTTHTRRTSYPAAVRRAALRSRNRHACNQVIAELQGSTIGATYLTGLQVDEMLARYSTAGDKTYLTDALGSITAQTDATGAVTQRYSYSAYGETTGTPQPANTDPNAVQYTGRENDGTGLYYYRARYYDPQLKRFTQSDPVIPLPNEQRSKVESVKRANFCLGSCRLMSAWGVRDRKSTSNPVFPVALINLAVS